MFRLALVIVLFVHCQGNSLQGPRGKNGDHCPYERPVVACEPSSFFYEEHSCYSDDECSPSLKCCQQGCVSKCVEPVHYTEWCKASLDVCILFDSKSEEFLRRVRKMIYTVVRSMSLNRTRVSLGTIAPNTSILTTFKSHTNVKKVWKTMETVKPAMTRGNLSNALYFAKKMFDKENGGRKDAIKVLLLFTDGVTSLDDEHQIEMASDVLREAGILVETIGVGEYVDIFNLLQIATSVRYVWNKVDQEFLQDLKKLEIKPCS